MCVYCLEWKVMKRGSALPKEKWTEVAELYSSGLPMRVVAEKQGVSIDAITYILRKLNIPRRTASEANQLAFESRLPSFKIRENLSKELELIGTILYWGEGYKTEKASGIDFTNSDPEMAELFMRFLRDRYILDECRIRPLVYCYSNQHVPTLISFWSRKLNVPRSQFTRPYVRSDYRDSERKMKYGLIHIRYSDKKLLLDVLNLIESYKSKYCVGGRVVKYTGL